MRSLKITVFAIMATFLTHFAVGQGHDAAYATSQSDLSKSVKIYPNPATELLSIRFETPVAKTMKLTLHNIIGNELPVESEVIDEFEIHVKVKDLPEGYYLLAVRNDENQRGSFKFLKR